MHRPYLLEQFRACGLAPLACLFLPVRCAARNEIDAKGCRVDERPHDAEPDVRDEHSGASTTSRPADHGPLSSLQVRSRYARRASRAVLSLTPPCRVPPVEARAAVAAVVSAVQPLPLRGARRSRSSTPPSGSRTGRPDPVPGPDTEARTARSLTRPAQVAPAPVTLAPAGSRAGRGQQRRLRLSQPAVGRGRGDLWAAACCRAGTTPRAPELGRPRPRSRRRPSLPPCCNGIATRTGMASRRARRAHVDESAADQPPLLAPTPASPPAPAEADTVQSAAPSRGADTGANREPAVLAQIPLVVLDPPRNSAFAPAGSSRRPPRPSAGRTRRFHPSVPPPLLDFRSSHPPPLPCRCRRALHRGQVEADFAGSFDWP